jgi:hypothetical protein
LSLQLLLQSFLRTRVHPGCTTVGTKATQKCFLIRAHAPSSCLHVIELTAQPIPVMMVCVGFQMVGLQAAAC